MNDALSRPPQKARLRCGRFSLDLLRPRIMAIVNLTPDSFSGDGVHLDIDAALSRAEHALEEGADLLDIGGESTRPGADAVSEQEELDRVLPLLERLAGWDVPVSVDTFKPGVMRAALRAGASMINDINAFREPGAIEAVTNSDAALCVMHMKGVPRTMQNAPDYVDVVAEVRDFLMARADVLVAAGIDRARVVLDPGFGFGKNLDHNLALLRGIERIRSCGHQVLIGLSRKTMLGLVTGRPVNERVFAGVAAAVLAVEGGARIIRTHDVAATRDAMRIWEAVRIGTLQASKD